jgi:cellulose synthase/poly-beta-1,6-N-acetylglucosamine synthase-like glycosyltransferase
MAAMVVTLLVVVAGFLAIPVVVLCLEIVAAILLPQRQLIAHSGCGIRRRVAVLVPAHNESVGLLPTIRDIQSQLLPTDRLLVIADNCTDDTADLARAAGAEVIERCDATRRGKGYALDRGLRHLSFDPPEIVIAIDADCRLQSGSIERLALTALTTGRPVQALNIVTSPSGSLVNHRVAEFAGRVKRWLRPLGLSVLGLPCQLSGTGMAFPYSVISSADLTSESIVEDVKLGLELSLAGYSPTFCPSASVTSEFPASIKGTKSQRRRWEQGHINMIGRDALRLFSLAIARHNWNLLVLTLDLAVPPLSLLSILMSGVFALTALISLLGFSFVPLIICTANLLIFAAAIFLAWLRCGRDILPTSSIWSSIPYAIGKLGLYGQILSGRSNAQWNRTDRERTE